MKKTWLFFNLVVLFLLFGVVVTLNQVFAWTEPSSAPPLNNVSAPINVSGNSQSKAGTLGLNGATASSSYGLFVNNGLQSAIKTFNSNNNVSVEVNRDSQGIYVSGGKQSYRGLYANVSGQNSSSAYLTNSDLSGSGFTVSATNLGGMIVSNSTGLYANATNVGIQSVSEKMAINSTLTKNNQNISVGKMSFFNEYGKPIGLGVYTYNQTSPYAMNSSAELGLDNIGIKAKGNQYAGYFDGNVYIGGALSVKSGCNGCGDLAEAIVKAEEVAAGDIVAVNSEMKLRRAVKSDVGAIGVVSANPSMTLNNAEEINGAPVALSGVVSVKVNNENGPINIGDFITASSEAGVGMKAVQPATVVGKAMQKFSGKRGEIKIMVGLSWYGGATCQK